MTCPRCGCPVYRVTGGYYTWTHDYNEETGRFEGEATGTTSKCVNCGLFQMRLPGKGIVSTDPPGPFEDEEAVVS